MERKQEKIKILFTIPNFDTAGSGKALLNIATRLEKTNFEPHIACSHNKGAFFNVVEDSGIPVHLFQTTILMTNRFNGLLQCWKISRKMKEINPHIIHSFHYAPDYSEALAARMAGIPWVYTKKNMNWGGKSKNGWKLRSFLASHILVQNMDMLREIFPSNKNVSLVCRGVDIKIFFTEPKDTKLMHKYNISNYEKVVLTVANLVPIKGIEILLDAFQKLSKNYDSVRLFIVGDKDNDYGLEMEKKAAQFSNSKKIHFVGKVLDVKKYYSIADVFVLPSKKESCPVSLLEAMASSIPVLASNVSGSRDILSDKPSQLFLPENPASLLDKLNWIISLDKKNRDDLIQNQLEIIDKKYSIEREVEQHELLYKNIFLH